MKINVNIAERWEALKESRKLAGIPRKQAVLMTHQMTMEILVSDQTRAIRELAQTVEDSGSELSCRIESHKEQVEEMRLMFRKHYFGR